MTNEITPLRDSLLRISPLHHQGLDRAQPPSALHRPWREASSPSQHMGGNGCAYVPSASSAMHRLPFPFASLCRFLPFLERIMTIVMEPMDPSSHVMSLESSLLAYQPSDLDRAAESGPFCQICSASVMPPSPASRAADARWISRIAEGYFTCCLCSKPSHRKCTKGFKDMPYLLLMGDVYYEYTCPTCYAASSPLVANTSGVDSLFRYKLGMNEITLLILYHLSLTTDSNVLIHEHELRAQLKAEPPNTTTKASESSLPIKLFHWKTIRDHIVLNWYKLWNKNPNKGGPNGWESQLSATLTNLSGISLVNGKFMANAPGYYGLLPHVKPLLGKDLLLAYRVGSKGELVKCPPLPCSRRPSSDASLPASTPSTTLSLASSQAAPSPAEPLSYWNTDFDLPNRPGPVSISKHADFTHPSHRIVEAAPLATPPRPCHSLSKQRGGYRMARASHGAFEGDWYYEICVPAETGGHVRVGWSMILGDLHAPVGFDEYSYAYGDVTGHTFHTRRPRLYGPTFGKLAALFSLSLSLSFFLLPCSCLSVGPGDVIGVHLHLPAYATTPESEAEAEASTLAQIQEEYPPLRLGEYKVRLKLHPGSFIAYYKNGTPLGTAFGPIYRGKYYPACSVYQGDVDICLGPVQAFRHWPAPLHPKPVTDMQDMNEAFDFEVNLTTNNDIQKKRKQRQEPEQVQVLEQEPEEQKQQQNEQESQHEQDPTNSLHLMHEPTCESSQL